MLRGKVGPACHAFIREYCGKFKGARFLCINGTDTHLHLAVQMEPFVSASDFIGKVKGACAHEMNAKFGPATLKWQTGYGVVSFAGKDLAAIARYIENQREHHAKGALNLVLETSGVPQDGEGEGRQPQAHGPGGDSAQPVAEAEEQEATLKRADEGSER